MSVGVTDIQTPSVVLMAEPANEVSTRWFRAKLFPTDCSPIIKVSGYLLEMIQTDHVPIDDTTRTGYNAMGIREMSH